MKPFVNILCNCDRQFFLHGDTPQQYTCTVRINPPRVNRDG
jgi:hypothetical protein